MTTYTVRYRKIGQLFWRHIRKVKADWVMPGVAVAVRCFETVNGNRFEIAMDGVAFSYGKERLQVIVSNMSKESGQKISV